MGSELRMGGESQVDHEAARGRDFESDELGKETERMPYKLTPLKRGFTEVAPLYELCQQHGATICGGYARYCASPKKTDKVVAAGDADLFPHSQDAHEKLLAALLETGYVVAHENHVSITLKPADDKKEVLEYIPTPQIIKPVVEGRIVTTGTTEEILDNFDFTIVRAAIISPTECLVDGDFDTDEQKGLLRLKNIHCPISSLLRCCKYARKGYFLRPSEALKLFMDWTDRGEEYRNRMIELFIESGKGKQSEENPDGMTQKEIDELESLLRID